MPNLEIFHKFDFYPTYPQMKIAFISIYASSNDLSRLKMLKLSILVKENDEILDEFDTYVKAVPSLSKSEKETLLFDYVVLSKSPPFCDIASEVIELLENAATVFIDRFSERVFKKAFREIGYPMGSASYILEKIFKNTLKSTASFNLKFAIEYFGLEVSVSDTNDQCRAMEMIFSKLENLDMAPQILSTSSGNTSHNKDIDFGRLPNHPGIYLFRDETDAILYVGKAKNISSRVRSHFTSSLSFEKDLCLNTASVDFEETGSETIALLLESHYITELKPPYNTQQKDIINPFILVSKIDSKGILRIQPIQKSYTDSENEFYYNRDSVISKLIEIQQKFNLCKRFTGIERTAGRCSDVVFCKGICINLEDKEVYNARTKKALEYIYSQRPSYLIKLKGRNSFESSFVLVRNGIYQGFGFIDSDSQINSIADIETYIKHLPHNYFTSRIIDQYFKSHRKNADNFLVI